MFRELYKEIEFSKEAVVKGYTEFPGEIFFKRTPIRCVKVGKNNDIETEEVGDDFILVQLIDDNEDKLEEYCYQVILAAGKDRNMVVYDSSDKKSELTVELLTLMNVTFRRHSGGNATSKITPRITDFFVRKSKITETFENKLEPLGISLVHGIEDKVWNEIENYYLNKLQGSLAGGDSNLIIGLSTNHDDFVIPKLEKTYGVACLNSNKILLGSY